MLIYSISYDSILRPRNRLWGNFALWAFVVVLFLYPSSGSLQEAPVYLSPPGLRAAEDPTIVIPATHQYVNRPPAIPMYRKGYGAVAEGWTHKYIHTRRFSSDRSAWVYYQVSDLERSIQKHSSSGPLPLRIWPVGTTIVLESYQGDAIEPSSAKHLETFVMHKTSNAETDQSAAFYSANWHYGRFTKKGDLSMDTLKPGECHQCHRIAFELTGDLIFTQFP